MSPKVSPPKFYLRDASAKKTTIYLRYNYTSNGKRVFKYATGLSVDSRHWDPVEMRAKTNVRPRTAADHNRAVNAEIEKIADAFGKMMWAGVMSRETLDQLRGGGRRDTLIDHFRRLIEDRESGAELTRKGTPYARASIDSYKVTLHWLERFNPGLYPEDVDMGFYHAFVAYMNAKGRSVNLIGGRIKHIKLLMRHLYFKGVTQNRIFEHPAFKKIQETSDTIYLSDAELARIHALDLDGTLDRVRDLFLIGAYTGLRFQDFNNLRPVAGDILKVVTRKTGETVFIPLHPVVRQVLEKHGGLPPAGMSNQKMNAYLKQIGVKAGLFERQEFKITKGGEVRRDTFEKWQKITTHTARRSFATNAYLAGLDTLSIMKITGHKTETSFLKYIKVSKEENARRMLAHPWFTIGVPRGQH